MEGRRSATPPPDHSSASTDPGQLCRASVDSTGSSRGTSPCKYDRTIEENSSKRGLFQKLTDMFKSVNGHEEDLSKDFNYYYMFGPYSSQYRELDTW